MGNIRLKRTAIRTFTLLIIVTALVIVKILVNSKQLRVVIKDNLDIEVNSKVNNLSYIQSVENGKILTKKKPIDTSKLGKQKITLKIRNCFYQIKTYSFYVNIIDTTKPKINFNNKISITEGDKIDLLKGVEATDNSNENIKVSILGEYDINKPGEYNFYYIAVDSSGNEAKEKAVLKVNKKIKLVNPKIIDSDDNKVTSKGFKIHEQNGMTYINGILIVNKTYSLPSTYNPGSIGSGVMAAFNEMVSDAKAVGLNIYITSGFRSYRTQYELYNNYVNRDGQSATDTYSARPGHSEHQSGLAFDLNLVNHSFEDTNEGQWLNNNCYRFGFILRYPKGKTKETGYIYEPWHFRYVGKDLANKLYNNGDWITIESYFGITSKYNY